MGIKHWSPTWFCLGCDSFEKIKMKCINCACNAKSMQKTTKSFAQKHTDNQILRITIQTSEKAINERKTTVWTSIEYHIPTFELFQSTERFRMSYIHMTYCARSISDSNMMLVLFWFCWLNTTKLGPNSIKIANKKHRKYTTENIKN